MSIVQQNLTNSFITDIIFWRYRWLCPYVLWHISLGQDSICFHPGGRRRRGRWGGSFGVKLIRKCPSTQVVYLSKLQQKGAPSHTVQKSLSFSFPPSPLSFSWHQNRTARVIINCPMFSGIIIFNGSTLNGAAKPLGRARRVDNGASSTLPLPSNSIQELLIKGSWNVFCWGSFSNSLGLI